MSYKATKGSTVLTPDIDGDQTALDLLPVTSAVPHSHIGKMCLACRNIGNASATSSGIKSGMYVLVTTPTIACVIFTKPVTAAIHTYIPLTYLKYSSETLLKLISYKDADVTDGKPIAVLLQSISDVSAINPLVAFYDIHGGKRGAILLFCPTRDTIK
jgi:hypothetical protein